MLLRMLCLALALAGGVGACSSSSGLNIDSSKSLAALSVTEQKELCDWIANQYSGYGKSLTCGGGGGLVMPLHGPTDQPSCISMISTPTSCPATVGNVTGCVGWKKDNVCAILSGMATQPPQDCAPLHNNPNCPTLSL